MEKAWLIYTEAVLGKFHTAFWNSVVECPGLEMSFLSNVKYLW
jgi:hypothetical protein